MTQKQFDRFKKIIQRLSKLNQINTDEYIFLDNRLGEIRRELVEKPKTKKRHNEFDYPNGSQGRHGW
jgi:hypothetical protein